MTLRVREVDTKAASAKADAFGRSVLSVVTIAAREDTRPFVPRLEGHLVGSADLRSRPSEGKLVYDTDYARAQYYGLPRKNKSVHPRATMQWFEHSKALNMTRWERAAKAEAARVFPGR